ncbi:MAG: SH3 domain-containing protein [Bdellovibrionota bacterium]
MAFTPLNFITVALAVLSTPAWADQVVSVTSNSLNVRTSSGAILCEVKQGKDLIATGRADGDWIKVKVNLPGCPKEGFVHSANIKGKASSVVSKNAVTAVVENEGLSFRNKPNLSEESYECALPKGTKLSPTPEAPVTHGENTWIKVKIPAEVKGCPEEGWVSKTYVKWQNGAAVSTQVTSNLSALPQVTRLTTAAPDNVPDCNGAGCNRTQSDPAIKQMNGVSNSIGRKIADEPAPPRPPMPIPNQPKHVVADIPESEGTFQDSLNTLIRNPSARGTGLKTNRGLVQIPLLGSRGNIGPCGSNHYQPDQPIGNDVYANPLTACVLTSILQDWKKICPDRSGCTLQFGDISDRSRPLFNSHHSHTQGLCVDIRPMRKGGFEDSPLTYTDSNYDRAMTRKLINLMKSKGANLGQFFFNDTGLGTRPLAGHSNHIHSCYPPNAVTRSVCANLKVDPKICPELP